MASTNWLPDVERRGLRGCVVSVNHIALIVSDVGRSLSFYTDVLGLQQLQRPNFDRHGAWLTAGNVEIHLIKGTPLVHTGDNLIVNHIALDVKDPVEAFQGLKDMNIPFEINVSVPKGEGKAESEGGGRGNTLSQAFLRDPDGYYIEMCNCDILTDFALGRSSGISDSSGCESLTCGERACSKILFYAMAKLLVLASRAKKECRMRKATRKVELEPLPVEEQPPKADPAILENFLARKVVYGDICQSFSKAELGDLLRQAGNHAPSAQLLMKGRFLKGQKRLLYPPSYYIESKMGKRKSSKQEENSFKFIPDPIVRRQSSILHVMTAGLSRLMFEQSNEGSKRRNTQHFLSRSTPASTAVGKEDTTSLRSKSCLAKSQDSLFDDHNDQQTIPHRGKCGVQHQANVSFISKATGRHSSERRLTIDTEAESEESLSDNHFDEVEFELSMERIGLGLSTAQA